MEGLNKRLVEVEYILRKNVSFWKYNNWNINFI